jgi:BASS family bile acid:Na+ symporter
MLALKLVLVSAVVAMVCAEGTLVTPRDLTTCFRRPSLLVRGAVAVVVIVPIVAMLVVKAIHPSRPVAVALAVLSAAPLAPFVLMNLAKTGEDFRVTASLHVTLAISSVVTAPIAIFALGRVLGFTGTAPPFAIARSVATSLLVPFAVGIAIHRLAPRRAATIRSVLATAGTLALIAAVVVIVIAGRRLFGALGARDYLAMIVFCALSIAAGHLLAFGDDEHVTFALESAARNPALALLLATSSFGHVRAAPVLVPYLIVYVVVSTFYTLWMAHRRTDAHPRVSAA